MSAPSKIFRKKEKGADSQANPKSLAQAIARVTPANDGNDIEQQHSMDEALWDCTERSLQLSGSSFVSDLALAECEIPSRAVVFSCDLSFNSLSSFLPASWCISLGGVLRKLELSGNAIEALPAELELLNGLVELGLAGNRIAELPVSLSCLSQLKRLYLQNNTLCSLPPEIGCLRQLEDLNLSGNALHSLPPEIGELRALEVLDVSGCELGSSDSGHSALPVSLTYCTRLIELNLGNNRLTSLPADLGRCTRLSALNVADNCLDDLPLSLGKCTGLARIGSGANIDRNPMSADPTLKEKARIGSDHLYAYLEGRMIRSGEPNFPALPALRPRGNHGIRRPRTPAMNTPQKQNGRPSSNASKAAPKPTFNNFHKNIAESALLRKWISDELESSKMLLGQLTGLLQSLVAHADLVKFATAVKAIKFSPSLAAAKKKGPRKIFQEIDLSSLAHDRLAQVKCVVLQTLIEIEFTLDSMEAYLHGIITQVTEVAVIAELLKDIKSRLDSMAREFPDLDLVLSTGIAEALLPSLGIMLLQSSSPGVNFPQGAASTAMAVSVPAPEPASAPAHFIRDHAGECTGTLPLGYIESAAAPAPSRSIQSAPVFEAYLEPEQEFEIDVQVADILHVLGSADAEWWKEYLY